MLLHMQGKEQMNFIKNKSWMILKILENENEIVPRLANIFQFILVILLNFKMQSEKKYNVSRNQDQE